jgi:putative ABC transport system permease protein
MFRKLFNSFALAFANIRSNVLHTFLSVLGIVIGVAALVSILSLIDGMEEFARDQISQTTSLNAIIIQTEAYKRVNEVRIRKDSISIIDYERFKQLTANLSKSAKPHIRATASGEATLASGKKIGALLLATSTTLEPTCVVAAGSTFTEEDLNEKKSDAVVNHAFLKAAGLTEATALETTITLNNKPHIIKGILQEDVVNTPKIYFPITTLSETELQATPPEIILEAEKTEEIPALKTDINTWLEKHDKDAKQNFRVITNEFRIEQATKGFLLFRVIMGLIVGISVLVGGIGVMNVLLISVTERTAEIGIRKATGANRRDIMLLFLSESITVSAFGSFLGLVLGVFGTMVIIPIIKAITEVPFQAAYTWNTFFVITTLSILVGIVFGTYPAIRASRLNPVEAIRHE